MKIAYLSTFYPYRGGIAQFNENLFNSFKELNHEIVAVNFKRQYPDLIFPGKTQYVEENDKKIDFDSNRILDSINPLSYLSTANFIKKFNPDFILTKFWIPFLSPSLGSVLYQLKNKSHNISIIDNAIPHESNLFNKSLTKFFLNQNHQLIAMSKSVENDLLTLNPKYNVKQLFHPFYDNFPEKIERDEALKKLNLDTNFKYLLFFGFIRDYKGLDDLIKSMSLMPENYKLIIAGEVYGDFSKYDKIIEDNNLQDKIIKHIRYISDSEVPIFFSASDLIMLTYKSATQSGILGICYHYSKPVIATDTGGMKEMIEPFNAGIVIPYSNEILIKDAVIDFFNNPHIFNDGIQNLKDYANWKNFAKEIIKLK